MPPASPGSWVRRLPRAGSLPNQPGMRRAFFSNFFKEVTMAKEELIEMNGVVMEVLPDSRFRVTLDNGHNLVAYTACLLYTSPSPRDRTRSRMPSSA